jgi:hypothetical protein
MLSMGKNDKLKNLDWIKIRKIVIEHLQHTWDNIHVEIKHALNKIEKSDGKTISFGGFDEFWSCNVDSKLCYLHVQIDCTKFLETRSNKITINVNFWGMNGKKILIDIDINKILPMFA